MARPSEVAVAQRPDLILAMAQGYSAGQLRPFAASLRQSGYRGEAVVFCHDLDRAARRELEQWDLRVVPFRNFRSLRAPLLPRKAFNFLARLYYRHKWPFFSRGWPLLLAAGKQRYHLYHRFLLRHPGRYRRVFLLDIRDIFFQRDPFEDCPDGGLVFFQEDGRHFLRDGVFNGAWIEKLLGQATRRRLENRLTLCAGTTMGSPEALIYYLEKFLELMRQARHLESSSGDQAIHNAVVYEHLAACPFSIVLASNDRGPVFTLARVPPEEIALSPAGEILSPAGRVAPVVHQYDRFEHLVALVRAKTGGDPRRMPPLAGLESPPKNDNSPTVA